jgi:serine/threonine protein phosphatase PrpC
MITKTILDMKDKKSKTHSQEIKYVLQSKELKKNKLKNLVSFDICSLPGTERGKQKINQDSYLMLPSVNDTKNCKIFGVFDGHGDNSDILSQEIRDYFIEYFSDNNIYNQKNILFNNNLDIMNKISNDDKLQKIYNLLTKNNYSELNKIFEKINNKLHDRYKENDFCLKSGSTSNIVIVMNDKKKDCLNKIISINLGDSKSLLINEDDQAIDLNIVHNPEEANERERIEKNGGEISRVDWADYGPLRVYYKEKHYPGLAMTRTFGDFNAESLGINTIPDIREYDFADKKPKIIIIATDGIWQFLSNEKVKDIVLPYYEEDNISGASQKLVSSALRMWETKNPEFIDDITVIILFFK